MPQALACSRLQGLPRVKGANAWPARRRPARSAPPCCSKSGESPRSLIAFRCETAMSAVRSSCARLQALAVAPLLLRRLRSCLEPKVDQLTWPVRAFFLLPSVSMPHLSTLHSAFHRTRLFCTSRATRLLESSPSRRSLLRLLQKTWMVFFSVPPSHTRVLCSSGPFIKACARYSTVLQHCRLFVGSRRHSRLLRLRRGTYSGRRFLNRRSVFATEEGQNSSSVVLFAPLLRPE